MSSRTYAMSDADLYVDGKPVGLALDMRHSREATPRGPVFPEKRTGYTVQVKCSFPKFRCTACGAGIYQERTGETAFEVRVDPCSGAARCGYRHLLDQAARFGAEVSEEQKA